VAAATKQWVEYFTPQVGCVLMVTSFLAFGFYGWHIARNATEEM
jgi:hypothetical protein